MTRRSKRELERAIENLEPDKTGDCSGRNIVIRHTAVDGDGNATGLAREIRIDSDADRTWSSETRTFDVPNNRVEGGQDDA